MNIVSSRKYKVSMAGRGWAELVEMNLEDLFQKSNDDTPEYVYAMQDIADLILDLKVYEHINFKPSRDEDTQIGIIYRVS